MFQFPLSRLGPTTPEWLVIAAALIAIGLCLVALAWGFILDRKYNGPYTLLAASNGQKWKRATIIMFVETVWIPLAGSLQALISPHPDQWPVFALFWGGIWVVAFPVAVLLKRWRVERQLATYRKMSAQRGMIKGVLSSRIFGWITWLMSAEMKRFVAEGYPEDLASGPRHKI